MSRVWGDSSLVLGVGRQQLGKCPVCKAATGGLRHHMQVLVWNYAKTQSGSAIPNQHPDREAKIWQIRLQADQETLLAVNIFVLFECSPLHIGRFLEHIPSWNV